MKGVLFMKKLFGMSMIAALMLFLNLEAHAGRSIIWPLDESTPAQSDTWTCGVCSACTMINSQPNCEVPKVSYVQVLEGCPNYNVFGFLIGPDPKNLASHMTDVCKRVGNQQVCYEAVKMEANTQDQVALEAIRSELMTAPVMVLTKSGVRPFPLIGGIIQLHNILVYGFDEDRNEYYIYDTNKAKSTLSGQDLIERWFWNTEDQNKPEFNPLVAGMLKNFGVLPKMYVRSKIMQ
jgi:hypothetical protein